MVGLEGCVGHHSLESVSNENNCDGNILNELNGIMNLRPYDLFRFNVSEKTKWILTGRIVRYQHF